MDGINDFAEKKIRKATKTKPRGAGSVSLPILTDTGLELAASLFAGTTRYTRGHHDATANVESFVKAYFPGRSRWIPRIIWDATRNGLVHLFVPKAMRRRKDYIHFVFYIHEPRQPSWIARDGPALVVWFNSIEYAKVLKRAVARYRASLMTDRILQERFIKAWNSIERHVENLDKDLTRKPEADYLRRELKKYNRLRVF